MRNLANDQHMQSIESKRRSPPLGRLHGLAWQDHQTEVCLINAAKQQKPKVRITKKIPEPTNTGMQDLAIILQNQFEYITSIAT